MWIAAAGLALLVLIVVLVLLIHPAFGAAAKGPSRERMLRSRQFEGRTFVNAVPTSMAMGLKETLQFFADMWRLRSLRKPAKPLEVERPRPSAVPDAHGMSVTWFGHSALLVEIEGKRLFLDPMLGRAPSPFPAFGGKRYSTSPPMEAEELPALDAVVLSHDHYDHLDYGTIVKLKDKVGRFFVPLGVGAHLERWGVAPERIEEHDWWEEARFEGLTLACTPSRHFSGRGLTDRNGTLWCSWVIRGRETSLYFCGDSGYGPHFREIGDKYGPFDLTLMECGQYDPRWAAIHMMPEETVQAHLDLRGQIMLPIHWGAFSLSVHSWTDPIERALRAAAKHGAQVITPRIGETVRLPDADHPRAAWWR